MVLVICSLREELISTSRPLLTQLKSRESSYPVMPAHRPHLWPSPGVEAAETPRLGFEELLM